jgi:hypothetical protein
MCPCWLVLLLLLLLLLLDLPCDDHRPLTCSAAAAVVEGLAADGSSDLYRNGIGSCRCAACWLVPSAGLISRLLRDDES